MPLGELFAEQFDYADVFNRLRLDDSEIALVCAVMIFNPGANHHNYARRLFFAAWVLRVPSENSDTSVMQNIP